MIDDEKLINENLDKINKTNFVFIMPLKEGGYITLTSEKKKKFAIFYDDSFNQIKELELNLGMNIYNTFCFKDNLFAISDYFLKTIQFFTVNNMEIKKKYKIKSEGAVAIEQINENKYIVIICGRKYFYERINEENFQIASIISDGFSCNNILLLKNEKFVTGYYDKIKFYNINFCNEIHEINNISIPNDVSMSLINENLLGICSFRKLNIININNYNIVNMILIEDNFYLSNIDPISENNFFIVIYKRDPNTFHMSSFIKKCKIKNDGTNFVGIERKENIKGKPVGLINIKGNRYIFLSRNIFILKFNDNLNN